MLFIYLNKERRMSDNPEKTSKYGYALLAGGAGKRMGGTNKAALEHNGRTFLEHICSEMGKTHSTCYLSAANHEQDTLRGWTAVKDGITDPDGNYIGPMGGIYSCLLRAKDDGLDGVFFAPCDAPLYTSEIHEKLAGYIDPDDDAVCWKTADRRIQTTFGWYSVRCLPALREDALSGKYKLIRTLERIGFKVIDTETAGLDDRAFMNVNSMKDYCNLKESRHILICGKRQVGKTTLVNRVIEAIDRPVYGFRTKVSAPDENGVRQVYMYPAGKHIASDDPEYMTAENHIGDTCRKVLSVNTEVFDRMGVSLIRSANKDGILVMDELGFMEENAKDFCDAVLEALDSDIPILATVKDTDKNCRFLEAVRNHPLAEVLMIDEENRDEVFRCVRDVVRTW